MNTTLHQVDGALNTPLSGSVEAIESLRASSLFAAATAAELSALSSAAQIETPPSGHAILHEGDNADDLYLLLAGELLVYTHDDLGNELPLARFSEAYKFVGEQAFLGAERARRSASVRTIGDTRLLRVAGTAFEAFLQQHSNIAHELITLGAAQVREKVSQQMSLLRFLDSGSGSAGNAIEQEFSADSLICTQGELGQNLYVVLSGGVRVYRTEPDGRVVQLARLQKGQSFGELSLVEGKPRLASVVAEDAVTVLAISREAFKQAYQGNQKVRDHVATLRGIYSYGGRGTVVQFTTELFSRPALGTLYKLADGRSLIANRVIGQDLWSIQVADMPTGVTQTAYTSATNGVERTLQFAETKLVGAVVKGPWAGISILHQLVLDGASLSDAQLLAFGRTGELEVAAVADSNAFVCQCMRVTGATLKAAIDSGCRNVEALSARTGAGTVCGGCVPKLATLTHESVWLESQCIEVIERTEKVKSFRFRVPASDRAPAVKPGQHLLIQANIDGVDVQRPYTLTSSITERGHYEITVMRQASGLMSNWLFDQLEVGGVINLMPPSGTFLFELNDPNPLICVVGGIGVTPALAMCRAALATESRRRIHVDYAVAARNQTVCADEWASFSAGQPTMSHFIRDTSADGRISAEAINKLVGEFPKGEWLICGSTPMQTEVQRLLRQAKVPAHRMHVESFHAIGTDTVESTGIATLSLKQRQVLGYGLLVAVALFTLQALVGVKWPLPAMMQSMTFSVVTGFGLIVLFVVQWQLGYVRLRDQKQDVARSYRLHIWLGPIVFAMLLLHGTHFGFALSFWLTVCFLASVASGAVLGINTRSQKWEKPRQYLLGGHILMSCVATGFALAHGVMSVWY